MKVIYIVSNLGRLMSKNKMVEAKNGLALRKGKILNPSKTDKGYLRTRLSVDNIKKNFFIHRLVAEAFIENLNNLPDVNHKDGNKENNRVDNLEWVTKQENHTHAVRTGLKAKGERHGMSKLTLPQVTEIKNMLRAKISYSRIAKIFNVTKQTIYGIKHDKYWQ
jgi:hypothetical protein